MAKTVLEIAVEHLDKQIAEFQRAKEILLMVDPTGTEKSVSPRKPRGRPKKAGLPPSDGI